MFRSDPAHRLYSMPYSTPTGLPLAQALDESLAVLFRKLQAEPAPLTLVDLADQLEAAYRETRIAAEERSIG